MFTSFCFQPSPGQMYPGEEVHFLISEPQWCYLSQLWQVPVLSPPHSPGHAAAMAQKRFPAPRALRGPFPNLCCHTPAEAMAEGHQSLSSFNPGYSSNKNTPSNSRTLWVLNFSFRTIYKKVKSLQKQLPHKKNINA